MRTVSLIMPVVLQNNTLLRMTFHHLLVLHPTWENVRVTVHVLCNRLHVCSRDELQNMVTAAVSGMRPDFVWVTNDVERSVAGAWNEGIRQAREQGADYCWLMANDVHLRDGCAEALLELGERDPEASIWSGVDERLSSGQDIVTDGCDFACFWLRPATVEKFGWFDENFLPAYLEDNDYCARVWLGGGKACAVHKANFYHYRSQTIEHDAEMAHHVRHWNPHNRDYFQRKWGTLDLARDGEDCRTRYYHHPFNDPNRPLSVC